jgi:hypothetical protein
MFSRDSRSLVLGLLWLIVGAAGVWAFRNVANTDEAWFRHIVQVSALMAWAAVLVALAVPSTVSLTAARLGAPLAIATALALAISGDSDNGAWITLLCASAAAVGVLFTAEIGSVYIQGSAYGSERRIALRPPAWVAVVVPVLWLIAAACLIGGVALLGGDHPWLALPVLVVGVAVAALLSRACHQLSRRWLVLVPAGLVVHDPMVLADTVMIPRTALRSVGPALIDTVSSDITANANGLVIEITVTEAIDIALAGRPGKPGATALVTNGLLVSPSRPGRFLQLASEHRLPAVKA